MRPRSLAFLAIPALTVVLCLIITGCGSGNGGTPAPAPGIVIQEAYAATKDVASYRFLASTSTTVEGVGEIDMEQGFGGEYVAPDRLRVWTDNGSETIVIGGTLYRKDPESPEWDVIESTDGEPSFATAFFNAFPLGRILEFMKSPGPDVAKLPDEAIDGEESWHYWISFDPAAVSTETRDAATGPEEQRDMQAEIIDQEAEVTGAYHIWIGTDDYLVRQLKIVLSGKSIEPGDMISDVAIPTGALVTATATMSFFDFNEPIEIEAPTLTTGSRPTIGDHRHATYEISICGKRQPNIPSFRGGVHTHSAGVIHLHPFLPSEEGSGARLVRWFEYGGGRLTQDEMRIPGQSETVRNGDQCDDGSEGILQVFVNGQAMDNWSRYIPQDDDIIRLVFGP